MITVECQNKFHALQEEEEENGEEENEEEPMEIIKETKELDLKHNSKVEGGTEKSMEITTEQNQMGTNTQKDGGKEEERIMRRLLQD